MNKWLLSTIVTYLIGREGYSFSDRDVVEVGDNTRAVVKDAFGVRYEIQIKVLGRMPNTSVGDISLKTGSYLRIASVLDV